MTSEVTSDLGIELSGLNYLCNHASVASISSNSIKFTEKAKHDPLTCVASPQVKSYIRVESTPTIRLFDRLGQFNTREVSCVCVCVCVCVCHIFNTIQYKRHLTGSTPS